MKIFLTVGTHAQAFDRLLQEADRIAVEQKNLEFFAQIGNCGFEPKNFRFKRFLTGTEYEESFKKADLIVSHGGAGSIINALKNGKPLIIVPRLKKFNEHTNDHQLELAKFLEKKGKAISVVDESKLFEAIKKAMKFKPDLASNKKMLVKEIRKFFMKN